MTMITERPKALVALLLLTGCGRSGDPFAPLLEEPAVVGALQDSSGAEVDTVTSARGPVGISADAAEAEYVQLALDRNPAIRAAQRRVERLSQRIAQARSLPDPMAHVAPFGDMAETAAGRVDVMTGLSQRIPFPGKLDARADIAAAEASEAAQDLERVRLEVVGEVRRAWWRLYESARAIEVTEQSRELLAQFRLVAESRLRAGTATQPDVLRASVELSQLDNDLVAIRQRQTSARAMLNALIDRPVTAPLPEPDARDVFEIQLDIETLLAEARRTSPDIRTIHDRLDGMRQRLRLARLDRWPDLDVSFSYNLVSDDGLSPVANGDDQWWVGFGINLPIWAERLDAAEAEALRGIEQEIAALHNARNRVDFRVQDALAAVESDQQQTLVFRDVIVPQARQTVEASLSSYRTGQIDFLTLVDNWRRLLEFELMYHAGLARLEQQFASLQQVVGRDLPRHGQEASP